MPVLTEKAIITASAIENRQVSVVMLRLWFISVFGIAASSAAWAEPPADTVGWQFIIIPVQNSFLSGATKTNETSTNVPDKPTKTSIIGTNYAIVRANPTRYSTRISWRLRGQTINRPALGMHLLRNLEGFFRLPSYTF